MRSRVAGRSSEWGAHALFFLCGLAPSWILVDGLFALIYTFDRTQPEGQALATYLGAVSASVNTVIVPAYDVAQRWLRWPMRRWLQAICYAQIGACALAAAAWPLHAGGFSVILYAVMLVASIAGNGQQLILLPWLAEECDNKRMAMAMAGGQAGVLVVACFAILQTAVGALGNPSYCFVFIGLLLIVSNFATREAIAHADAKDGERTARQAPTEDSDDIAGGRAIAAEDGGPCVDTINPLQIRDDAVSADGNDANPSDDSKRRSKFECCAAPFVAFSGLGRQPWRHELNAVAWTNAYLQLVAWVCMRSTLPYTFKAVRPKSAGRDGGSYLSVAVNASLISCFVGSMAANRPQAKINVALVIVLSTSAFVLVGVCTLVVRPPADTPAYAIAAILAAVLVRGLDGYYSPLFYRASVLLISRRRECVARRSCPRSLWILGPCSPGRRLGHLRRDGWGLDRTRPRRFPGLIIWTLLPRFARLWISPCLWSVCVPRADTAEFLPIPVTKKHHAPHRDDLQLDSTAEDSRVRPGSR